MTSPPDGRRVPTTAETYLAFDAVIRDVERWIAGVAPTVPRCAPDHVRRRIVQEIVLLANEDFSRQFLTGQTVGRSGLDVGGLHIDRPSGRVTVSPRLAWRNFLRFGQSWLRLLVPLVRSLAAPSGSREQPTLMIEAGLAIGDSDRQFVEFCREGPLHVLREAETLVIEAARPAQITDTKFRYVPNAIASVAESFLTRGERWRLMLTHLRAPFTFIVAVGRSSACVLLGRDLALTDGVHWLDQRNRVAAIVTSTSAFAAQPLWMKGLADQRFKLHMAWYSQNFVPKMYIGDASPADLPQARHMRVDVHWVWTEGFRDYLRGLGESGEIQVVGPILWYLPASVDGLADSNQLRVAVFDITPFAPGKAVFGAAKNYYSVTTITQFVRDIVSVCDELSAELGRPIAILLKHKRPTTKTHHDSNYLQFLDDLATTHPTFTLIDHRTNNFGLLEASDISVSVPYTSTAYVSAVLRKPALYYDPFAELVPLFEKNEHVHFAAGRERLRDVMASLLGACSPTTRA